jgi:N6-L-threonylcarbamoyladenine synthase
MSLVLGIESSCDETAAAVVADGVDVRSSVIESQVDEHAVYGGVVPELASRSHLRAIRPVVERALAEAGATPDDLDLVAVTNQPGLLGSLLIGATAAKALAWSWDKPLVGVHHIEAHVYAALMTLPEHQFPYVTLVVSGGHTSLYLSEAADRHRELGSTRDDAAGEALDKAAAMLNLSYPGGPAIQRAAEGGDPKAFPFKRPLLDRDSLEFSFSGLKTALLYRLHGPGGRHGDPWLLPESAVPDLCASFEQTVVDTLIEKCRRAMKATGVPRLLVGGGVALNRRLRQDLTAAAAAEGFEVTLAPPEACTDNAIMIAGLGHELWRQGRVDDLLLDVTAAG